MAFKTSSLPLGLAVGLVLAVSIAGLPAAAQPPLPGALHRWFLAEGATGPLLDMDILVANPNATPADITLTFLNRYGLPPVTHSLTMPAASRATIRANNVPGEENAEPSVVVECTNGLDILVERSMYWPRTGWHAGHNSPGVTTTSTIWYLAEGAINNYFETYILVANPDPTEAADVVVTFLRADGTTIDWPMTLAPNSRDNVVVHRDVPELIDESFATVVESRNGVGIVVERAMYWGPNWKGGHGGLGQSALSSTWHFAEGYTGRHPVIGRFHTWFQIANPDPSETAHVAATYYTDAGATIARSYDVVPRSRLTIYGNGVEGLQDSAFATLLTSDLPIVAERALYWGRDDTWVEGHVSPGATTEATSWGFAEGTSENGFETYLLVRNATSSDMVVHATFLLEDGTGTTRDFQVAAHSRFNIVPGNDIAGLRGMRYAAFLESAVPFVAERAVYWGPDYTGGHASVGTPWPGTVTTPPPLAPRGPSITAISPASGATAGGNTVTITGTHLLTGAIVRFGGARAISATTPLGDSATMTVVVPPHASGVVDVTVTNPDGRQGVLPNAYTYLAPVPTLLVPDTLAFGDSITYGTTSFLLNDAMWYRPATVPYPFGLRERLAARYPAQPVTVENAGVPGEYVTASRTVVTDGVTRWEPAGRDRLPTVITAAHDLVIILEGVNDTTPVATEVVAASLRAMVDAARSAGKRVILSTLTPVIQDVFGGYKADPARVAALNDAIRALASTYASDRNVVLVDMFAAFPPDRLSTLLSPDGLHPSDAGYQFMAQVFFDAIVARFGVGG